VARAVGGQRFNERKFIKKANLTKLWAIQGSKLTKMKANSQYKSLFNTAKLYSHLAKSPLRFQTARKARQWAWEKQPARPLKPV